MDDPELKAMAAITNALAGLAPDVVKRVLDWATNRFSPLLSRENPASSNSAGIADRQYDDFPALFDAADPQTATDKALVAGYWFQVVQSQEEFDSFALNKELKNLGYPSSNITRDFDALMSRTPRLAIQTRKMGTSKQARKQFKLTREGIRYVQDMLRVTGNKGNAV